MRFRSPVPCCSRAVALTLLLLLIPLVAPLLPPVRAQAFPTPKPPGKIVNLGGHRLHMNCTGKGRPTVVVENGLGDFSFDWYLVQSQVSTFTRICTYDRAGYAWSDPGPKPRTFSQLNLELHDALAKLGEHGPFVLVGHSYGGVVIRNFALSYQRDVAGMVFVDSAFEGQRVGIGGKKTIRLGEDAKHRSIPPPHESMSLSDSPAKPPEARPQEPLGAMYKVLPPPLQQMHLWAQSLAPIEDAENSQREWSSEYFARWLAQPQQGTLGRIPVIVLAREKGGYNDGDYDIPGEQMERERKAGQAGLANLSSNSKLVLVPSGHNMELEAPDLVTAAIREVVEAARSGAKIAAGH